MKKLFLSFSLLLPVFAFAQMTPTTKQVCYRRCTANYADVNPQAMTYKEKLNKIREQRKVETDDKKIKELEVEEQNAVEKLDAFVEKQCTFICRNQPED